MGEFSGPIHYCKWIEGCGVQCFSPIMKTKITVRREFEQLIWHEPSVDDRARFSGLSFPPAFYGGIHRAYRSWPKAISQFPTIVMLSLILIRTRPN